MKRNKTALLSKYSLMYESNPRSRVFAPLAEVYRKLGMLEKSYEIIKKGLRNYPDYTLAYVILAKCYFDEKKYDLAFNTIRPFVSKGRDNITMQKLFARTCIELGQLELALETYKFVLFLNPKDNEAAAKVLLLEDDLLVHDEAIVSEKLSGQTHFDFDESEDNWVQVDFTDKQETVEVETKTPSESRFDYGWKMSSPLEETQGSLLKDFKEEIQKGSIQIKEHSLDDEYLQEDFDTQEEVITLDSTEDEDAPFINLTLVDLYCNQGHHDKALSILDSILKLHPNDKTVLEKKRSIEQGDHLSQKKKKSKATDNVQLVKEAPKSVSEEEVIFAEDDHEKLIDIIDNSIDFKQKKDILNKKFERFLSRLKDRSGLKV